jgi:hypothetical protein
MRSHIPGTPMEEKKFQFHLAPIIFVSWGIRSMAPE